MPLAADPNQTFKVILDSDAGKDNPPAFLCRYLTLRQWRQAAKLYDAFFAADTKQPDAMADKLMELIGLLVVGRENMPDSHLEDLLTVYEARELMSKAFGGQRPTAEDKKKLSLPSEPSTENPAAPAVG